MKLRKKITVVCLIAALITMLFGFSVSALAEESYLQGLTVQEKPGDNSQSVAVTEEMTADVSASCDSVVLTAETKEGYTAYVRDGELEYELNGYTVDMENTRTIHIVIKDSVGATVPEVNYTLILYKTDTSVRSVELKYNDGTYTASKVGDQYLINIPSGVSQVELKVNTGSDRAKVLYDGNVSDNKVTLTQDETKVKFVVIPYEGAPQNKGQEYTLTLVRSGSPMNEAGLSALTADKGSISPAFSSSTQTYTVTVPYGTSATKLTATAKDSTAKVLINTSSTASPDNFETASAGSVSFTTPSLTRGQTVNYYVHVLAADGETMKTYTVKVYRSNHQESDEARLKSLSVRNYSILPSFDDSVHDYYLVVPRSEDEVRVNVTARDSHSEILVDGHSVDSGSSRYVDLGTGNNDIEVKVTSEDGTETETYDLHIYRSTESSGSDYAIEDLTVKTGAASSSSRLTETTLDRSFSGNVYSYIVDTKTADKYFTVKWEPKDRDSVAFLIYGDTVRPLSGKSYVSAVKMDEDLESFTVRAYSPDCKTSRDYNFTFDRYVKSSDAYLSDLVVRVNGAKMSLSPEFDEETVSYSVAAASTATYVTITPTAADANSSITVNGREVKSGGTSTSISLVGTTTRIPIIVTAEDGSNTCRYYVTINKNNSVDPDDPSVPGGQKKIIMKLGSTSYTVNGENKLLRVAPYMDQKVARTMVPIRAISEAMGATVNFSNQTKIVEIIYGGKTLTMTLGQEISGGSPSYGTPNLISGTTFVPVRYVSEQLNARVDWDGQNQTVTISQ